MSSSVNGAVNGAISFWYAHDGLPSVREPLAGDTSADVVIVGGGYTGLWTAYYLKKAVPFLRITVLEQKFCGYGASGRNGGWLYNGIAGRDRYAKLHGHEAAVRLQRAMNDTVDEVVRAAAEEGIDADIHKGGVLEVARTPAQLARLKEFHAHELSYGEKDRELYGARETAERIRVADAVGSTWTPHGARLHPVKLVKGLAAAVEALGVTVHELTPVTEIRPKHAVTPYGTVRAPYVLRCTEGFTAGLKGQRRTWLPMNSSMIATEPLSPEQWESVGWAGLETLGDMAHAYMYAQRTADGRIALGGRGCRTASARAPTTTAARSPRPSRPCGRSSSGSSRRWPGCASTTPGRASWAYRATGARPSPWTGRRGSAGRAATSARAWPPPTSPRARSAISSNWTPDRACRPN
ncbi:FAD-dependent oxidoreductase [Streptomyces sp. MS1.AVA.1]|uniref:FAD-dependent oxidoreductase n=1 Tax=Streptomyces machairae TaxID=3134109 RepID=A0ABU8ULX8_9ACTN